MEPKKRLNKVRGFNTKSNTIGFKLNNPVYVVYEPSIKTRYVMEIPLGNRVITFFVHCEIPVQRVDSSWLANQEIGRERGRLSWNPIRVKIIDLCGSDLNWEYDNDEVIHRLKDWFGNVSFGNSERTFKKNITVQQLDPTGVIIGTWLLMGAFPSNIIINQNDDTSYHTEFDLIYDHCNITI